MKEKWTLYGCLIWLLCQLPAMTWAQVPHHEFEYSLERILVGFEAGTPEATALAVLNAEAGLFPSDERMQLADGTMYIAWTDPAAGPSDPLALQALMDRLESRSEVRYAHPFVLTGTGEPRGLTDRLYVRPGSEASLSSLLGLAQTGNFRVEGEDPYLPGVYRLRVDKASPHSPLDVCLWLREVADFSWVDVDYLFQMAVTTNDPLFNRQWALTNSGTPLQGNGVPGADMSVPDAWTLTTGDSTVLIAIIDSGTDTLHPDLMTNLVSGFDATGGNSGGFPNTDYPNDGHGTACAGIVAAEADNSIGIAGVCHDCRIVPVKVFYYVFNPFGSPLPFSRGGDMADAISWAWQVAGADILSNSWGITDDILPLLPDGTGPAEAAIRMALDSARGGKGGLLFFSSGNEGDAPIWPSRMHGVFSVNATTMCDERKHPASCDGQNWEGNWGDSLDVSAPGVMIAATDIRGADGFDGGDYMTTFGGTSAACPNAAGVMGLVLSVNNDLTLEQAHYVLESTCDKVGGYTYGQNLASGTWSAELGYGRLNAHSAVMAAMNFTDREEAVGTGASFSVVNPVQGRILLTGKVQEAGMLRCRLLDLQGKMIWEANSLHRVSGAFGLAFDISAKKIPQGLYLLEAEINGGAWCEKVLIIND